MYFRMDYKKILLALTGVALLALPATTKAWQATNALAFGGTDAYVTFALRPVQPSARSRS